LTGEKTLISNNSLAECNGSELFGINASNPNQPIMYSVADPVGKSIKYMPTYFAASNPQLLYSLYYTTNSPIIKYSLYISTDSGQTWQDRNPNPNASSLSIVIASSDGKSLYALAGTAGQNATNYTLYFSTDIGTTWHKYYQVSLPIGHNDGFILQPIAGQNSANFVALEYFQTNISPINDLMVSADGGQTFNDVGQTYNEVQLKLYYTSKGIIREQSDSNNKGYTLARSTDGKNWQNLTLPINPAASDSKLLHQDPNAPNNLFLSDPAMGDLWWSADAGSTWQKVGTGLNLKLIFATDFLVISDNPLTLAVLNNSYQLYLLDGLDRTASVAASSVSGNIFFKETGHNLSGVFLQYWQTHGGLAQFGFPKTEQFKEYNPADGNYYLVQYFERNRFEYHPEFAGSQYAVELGLLGNQQTANRHQEAPFQLVQNPNSASTLYFSQTGHTLSGKFLDYWNVNGGLSIYGYPISEPFQEVNPDDGKVYTVQYFERNRFEYHPEFAGSKYEVELGLLGNTLLKAEGWLK
jgi:hypothetical protein